MSRIRLIRTLCFANIKRTGHHNGGSAEAVNSANCMNVYTDLLKELADKQNILLCWMCQWERGAKTEKFQTRLEQA